MHVFEIVIALLLGGAGLAALARRIGTPYPSLVALAFILVGFQLKSIISRLDRSTWFDYVWVAAAVCGAAILARIAWVTAVAAVSRWRCRSKQCAPGAVAVSPRAAALVGWCGMRGIVTLAAALALPTGGGGDPAFPYRDLILFTAFSVVLGTLVLQGLSLRPLLTYLQLDDDGAVEREVRLARVATLRAALEATAASSGTETADLVRRRFELQLRRAEAELDERADGRPEDASEPGGPPSADVDLVRAAMAAERQRLSALRADGTIGDAAFQQVEQELDWKELDLQQLLRTELT